MTADVLKILRWMVIGWAGALYLGTCLALCIAGCTKTLSFLPPTSKTYREPTRWKEPGGTGATNRDITISTNLTAIGIITDLETSGLKPGSILHIGRGVGGGAAGARQDIPDHLYTNKP